MFLFWLIVPSGKRTMVIRTNSDNLEKSQIRYPITVLKDVETEIYILYQ